jgi:hypothetical protein
VSDTHTLDLARARERLAAKGIKAAPYLRVSTIEQSTENQLPDLEALTANRPVHAPSTRPVLVAGSPTADSPAVLNCRRRSGSLNFRHAAHDGIDPSDLSGNQPVEEAPPRRTSGTPRRARCRTEEGRLDGDVAPEE